MLHVLKELRIFYNCAEKHSDQISFISYLQEYFGNTKILISLKLFAFVGISRELSDNYFCPFSVLQNKNILWMEISVALFSL